ncbi:MAG TPA: hypothetical protein VFB36_15625 [Nevskiaceae bacterium]|nr:hypothetical protein [Nevskiaceae bacterium]
MKKYLTGAIALALLSMSGLVSAQGTTDPTTTPSTTAEASKSTTQKAKHHHKHAHKATKAKSETPKQ